MSSFFREELYRIGKVSKRLGVSIPTIRNWIYSEKLNSLKTAGGEHIIPESEIRRFRSRKAKKIVNELKHEVKS